MSGLHESLIDELMRGRKRIYACKKWVANDGKLSPGTKPATSEGSFLNEFSRLQKSWRPREKLAPSREVGA
jgi:hypothetical protein